MRGTKLPQRYSNLVQAAVRWILSINLAAGALPWATPGAIIVHNLGNTLYSEAVMAENGRQHLKHEALVGGISNAVFNGLIAWLMLRSGPALAWGGQHSFAVDVIATALLLPLIVALIVIPLQRGKLNRGKLQAIYLGRASFTQSLADRFPASTFKSALLFGLLGMCAIAPLTLFGFFLLGVEQVQPLHYALFKGLWAGLMAAVLVIPMVLVALRGERTAQTTGQEN